MIIKADVPARKLKLLCCARLDYVCYTVLQKTITTKKKEKKNKSNNHKNLAYCCVS